MKAVIGLLSIELYVPDSHSLKEKRAIIRRIKDRIKNKYNVSVAETDFLNKWQRSEISILKVGNDYKYITSSLENILVYIEEISLGRAEILNKRITFL